MSANRNNKGSRTTERRGEYQRRYERKTEQNKINYVPATSVVTTASTIKPQPLTTVMYQNNIHRPAAPLTSFLPVPQQMYSNSPLQQFHTIQHLGFPSLQQKHQIYLPTPPQFTYQRYPVIMQNPYRNTNFMHQHTPSYTIPQGKPQANVTVGSLWQNSTSIQPIPDNMKCPISNNLSKTLELRNLKKNRKYAIPILNPVSGVDVTEEFFKTVTKSCEKQPAMVKEVRFHPNCKKVDGKSSDAEMNIDFTEENFINYQAESNSEMNSLIFLQESVISNDSNTSILDMTELNSLLSFDQCFDEDEKSSGVLVGTEIEILDDIQNKDIEDDEMAKEFFIIDELAEGKSTENLLSIQLEDANEIQNDQQQSNENENTIDGDNYDLNEEMESFKNHKEAVKYQKADVTTISTLSPSNEINQFGSEEKLQRKTIIRYSIMELKEMSSSVASKRKPNIKFDSNLIDIQSNKYHTKTSHETDNASKTMNKVFPHFAQSQPIAIKRSNQYRKKLPAKNQQFVNTKPLIYLKLSTKEEIILNKVENAWQPTQFTKKTKTKGSQNEKTENIFKTVRSILNKLTPENFNKLLGDIKKLDVTTSERLNGIIELIFEKAIDEPNFAVTYAQLCKEIATVCVPSCTKMDENVFFQRNLIKRVETEFNNNIRNRYAQKDIISKIKTCEDATKQKEIQNNFKEEDQKIKRRAVGTVRFIGELFKMNLLTSNIMLQCIEMLLDGKSEDQIELLCKLLTTIGNFMDNGHEKFIHCFTKLNEIVSKKTIKISNRVKFMILDVIDLKNLKWIPRRPDLKPQTMNQIQKESDRKRYQQ